MSNNNQLSIVDKDIIKKVKEIDEHIRQELIPSVGFTATELKLSDYELYFRRHYIVRFNTVTTKYERAQLVIKDGQEDETVEWVELEMAELHNDLVRGGAKKGTLTEGELKRMLADRRLVPAYDPLTAYFENSSNLISDDDDFDYIDDYAKYLKVEGGEKENIRWRTNFKKALVRTVKCAINNRYFNKHVLVLYSSNQSVGKTSYWRSLIPSFLQGYAYEGVIGTDKDSQTVLAKNFFVLIDELANLSRVDINVLKAIISKLTVNIRLPYAATFCDMPRRCSFFATTNRADFLTDSENVRWLVFNVDSIDKSYGDIFTGEFKVDIDKIWAQAYKLYKSGYACELTKEDMAINEDNNVLYSATSLEKEVINTYLLPASAADSGKLGYGKGQSTDLFELCCQHLEEDGKLHSLKNMRQSIFFIELGRISGWKKTSFRIDGRVVSGYHYIDIKKSKEKNNQLPF